MRTDKGRRGRPGEWLEGVDLSKRNEDRGWTNILVDVYRRGELMKGFAVVTGTEIPSSVAGLGIAVRRKDLTACAR